MCKSYHEALRLLNSTKTSAQQNLNQMRGTDDMAKWLEMIGYPDTSFTSLNIIHVAGTNGKGGTCAYASTFLQCHGLACGYPSIVGLYTSPHIMNVRERIQINNEPVTEELFARYFFEVWEKLPHEATPELDVPRYLQLLALLSLHVFTCERVDVAVYETHMGGEYDATNIVSQPVVTGISTIAMDHVDLLGPTIEDIAWHKAGILKKSSCAFSMPQQNAVEKILRSRACEKAVTITFVDGCFPIESEAPPAQRLNARLAEEIVQAWLAARAPPGRRLGVHDITQGLERVHWPGRFHYIKENRVRWFLDSAHNIAGLEQALPWYGARSAGTRHQVLVFSHFSRRHVPSHLSAIRSCALKNGIDFRTIVFTTYNEKLSGPKRNDRNLQSRSKLNSLDEWAAFWQGLDPSVRIFKEPTIEEALERVRSLDPIGIDALITGSIHLVSGALFLFQGGFQAVQ